MIAAVKALHIVALISWCAGLIALPILLATFGRTDPGNAQTRFTEFRRITHFGYTLFATPAAIVAIAAGTALLFLAGVTAPWFFAKLALVAGMALVHAWLGHLIVQSGEEGRSLSAARPVFALLVALPLMGGVLWLVLAKPDLTALTNAVVPSIFMEPQDRRIPRAVPML